LQTLLGFDFGLQRIGVAVGQQITGTATALGTINSRDGQPDWKKISGLLQTWRPDALVVGLPLTADGRETDFTQAIRRFVRQLEGRYQLPVHTIDERLSTREAAGLRNSMNEALTQYGTDALAACIILQNWLDTCNEINEQDS
jgi:putative Holliday junction resolvase